MPDDFSQLTGDVVDIVDDDTHIIMQGQQQFRVTKTALQTSLFDSNPTNFIYLKGDEDTDGSLRIVPDLDDEENFEFQLRTGGVWNDTGIQIAASTIHLGRDLRIGGAGDWVRLTNTAESLQALIP